MKKSQRTSGENKSETNSLFVLSIIFNKGVPGGPSGPSREGPGVGHKIVSDTRQMTKEREKKRKQMSGKREKCVKKKKWKKERERKMERNKREVIKKCC